MSQPILGLSNNAFKKYRSLIISLLFLILMTVASILASLYLNSLYNKAFSRYSGLTHAIDLHHDFLTSLQAASDPTNSSSTRLHFADMAVKTYDDLSKFYPSFLNGGIAQYGSSKILKDTDIAAPLDNEDKRNSENLYNKVLNTTLMPHKNLIDKLRGANNSTFDSDKNIDVELNTEMDSELVNWAAGDTMFNDVRENLQQRAENYNQMNKILTLASVSIILIYFAFISFSNLRRLVKSDEAIESARRETDDIMKNVNTGLFLLDKDLNIGSQYSTQLENIISENNIGGKNLTSILQNKVSAKDLETTQSFVKQLYNPRVKEKLVNDLNPLKKVMINDKKNQSRFLDFKFSRVYNQDKIAKILVNVQDVTQQIRLEQRLEQERAQNDLQIEMLTTILNVNPSLINEFINNTHENIIKINNILKSSGSTQYDLQEKLAGMYRIMHSLKGEASVLKLHSFIKIAANFEDILKDLQNRPNLTGNDFLPLTIHLDEMLNLSNTIEALGNRINHSSQMPSTIPPINPTATKEMTITEIQPSDKFSMDMVTSNLASRPTNPNANISDKVVISNGKNQLYSQFADSIALRQGKEVNLKAVGFNEVKLSRDLEKSIKEIVIQLIRNAVVHGIESPESRIVNGKTKAGAIKVTLLELSENYKLIVEDDGKGIDYDAIREKAIKQGYESSIVATWDKTRLTNLIFKPGFSTNETTDEDAGRGVGMDIIKAKVQELHGHLNLDTQPNKYTRFVIKIPKNP